MRELVAKHFMTCKLKELEQKKFSYKVDVLLATKMMFFREALETMFPGSDRSIGEKLDSLNKNLFINEFLYGILDSVPLPSNQMVMRRHYRLDDEFQQED